MRSFLFIKLIIYIALFVCVSQASFAAGVGIGQVADNIMQPVLVFSDFIYSGCLLIGGSFIFASIIKYNEHKRSPLMVPISTVIFLLIAGIVLILLPFLAYLTDYGVPYALIR